jgi:hypothetical protein
VIGKCLEISRLSSQYSREGTLELGVCCDVVFRLYDELTPNE